MQKMTLRLTTELRRLAFEHHDSCSYCGNEFKEVDTSHSGYDINDKPVYVCDKCSFLLKETAVRHHYSPRSFEVPNHESQLWRYMDFTKYVSMLSSSGLFFSRADLFDDHFEGAKGIKSNKKKWDDHHLSFFQYALRNPPVGVEWDQNDDYIEQEAQRLLRDLDLSGESGRKNVFINCWHENKYESEAMWRLYSSYLENAIAVRSTYSSLYESLGKNPSISIGRVKYIDFNKNFAGLNDSFWRKRKSFEHEREVRAIFYDLDCKEKGKMMSCDINTLVEEVFLSPSAPGWFVEIVNEINDKFGLKVKVSQSKLNDEPFY